jgi:O-antigen ligase
VTDQVVHRRAVPVAAVAPGTSGGGWSADRTWFLVVVLLATFVGNEFPADGPASPWFVNEVFGVPLHYPLFAGALLLLAPYIVTTPHISVSERLRAVGLGPWTVMAWGVLAVTIALALLSAAPELFADWRNLVAVAATVTAAAKWLSSRRWRNWALTDMAVAYGIAGIPYLVRWAVGAGTRLYDVRISVFFGPTLFMSIFSSVVTLSTWLTARRLPRWYGRLVRLAAVSSSLVVVLSFRRSFWLGWTLGVAGVVAVVLRRRQASPLRLLAASATVVAIGVAAFVATGTDAVVDRLASFLPSENNEYATTNEDHVNDLIDALGVIADEPIFGLGIGRYYETSLIADWKETSFEVHNTVLHVWLKFGLLGVVAYLGFHYRWARSMWTAAVAAGAKGHPEMEPVASTLLPAALIGAAIYLTAQFIATMVGTWPYGSFQMSLHHGFLLAAFLAIAPDLRQSPRAATRPSRPAR